MPDHRTPTRRQLLAAAGVAAAAAAGLSGCAEAAHRDPVAASGDETLARETARASAGLLAAYFPAHVVAWLERKDSAHPRINGTHTTKTA